MDKKTYKEGSEERYHKDLFDTSHLEVDLKGRSVRGGGITLLSQIVKFVLHMASTMVLARLLTPQDYGLVAMTTAIIGFAALFKDLGLSAATIQQKEVTHQQVSALFWINLAISISIATVLCALAPLISLFYNESRLTLLTCVLATTFIFSGLTIQHQALLRRQMKFMILGGVEIGSIAVGVVGAIVMAKSGMGYWALVGLPFFSAVTNAILVWCLCSWRPVYTKSGDGIRKMLKFGGHITGFNLINYFSRNLDNILLGKFWGAEALGLYSKAYSIMMLPIQHIRGPLESVAMPALSRMQDDPGRYCRYYLKLIEIIAFLSMPLMVFLFVCAEDVILLLLGPNWSGASNIFKVLCLAAFVQPVASTRGLVLLSLGYSGKYLKWGVANGIITILSFVIGLRWGAIGVAIAYTIATYLILFPSLWYCFRGTPVTVSGFIMAAGGPVVMSALMGVVIWVVRSYLTDISLLLSLGMLALLCTITYLTVLSVFPKGRALLRELLMYRKLF